MKFRVAVLNDSIHTQCFAEVADSIEWALRELGHEVERGVKPYLGPEKIVNILFGVRPGEWSFLKPDTIIFNGEQATPASLWRDLHDTYKHFRVWDYSRENAKRYPDFGLPVPVVVRPGYCPVLEGRIPHVEKTHDVVFFGSLNDRRRKLLADLREAGMSVLEVPFGVYGAERDAYLGQARIAVNCHYYENSIFESVRCSYLMHNGIPVVTEDSAGVEVLEWLGEQVSERVKSSSYVVPYEALVGRCKQMIQLHDYDLDHDGLAQREAVKEISLLEDVRAALEVMEQEGANRLSDGQGVDARLSDGKQGVGCNRTEITLCMICKDERDVIERCLASVKPYITRWCIVDTGSTDGTQEIIRSMMADVPGQLHECSWKNFDGSRTEAIELAQKECDGQGWLLLIDSDEILTVEGELRPLPGYDLYNFWCTRGRGQSQWGRVGLIKASKRWKYVMPRHEYLECQEVMHATDTPIEGALVISSLDGARAKEGAYLRFSRDAEELNKWLLANPNHPGAARAVMYMAKSYHWATEGAPEDVTQGLLQKALQNYLRRAGMKTGFVEEIYTGYYQAAFCMRAGGYPWDKVQATFLQAFAFRPSRAEGLYEIARHYIDEKSWHIAEIFARAAAAIPLSKDISHDVHRAVYLWSAKDFLGIVCLALGKHREAIDLYREIVDQAPFEEQPRMRVAIEACALALGE